SPDEAALEAAREHCRSAAATVLADPVVGPDSTVLDLAESSARPILVETRPPTERNHAGPDARACYRDLESRALTASIHGLVPAIAEATSPQAVPADD
ncbi:iron complex transport system ATP-binding protein, partial [Halorhabdus tiamatea SARL4B]